MDCGAPQSVCGSKWLKKFIIEKGLKKEEMNPRKVKEGFVFGSGDIYESTQQLDIPMNVKNKNGDLTTIKLEACVVEADIPYLVGWKGKI